MPSIELNPQRCYFRSFTITENIYKINKILLKHLSNYHGAKTDINLRLRELKLVKRPKHKFKIQYQTNYKVQCNHL